MISSISGLILKSMFSSIGLWIGVSRLRCRSFPAECVPMLLMFVLLQGCVSLMIGSGGHGLGP